MAARARLIASTANSPSWRTIEMLGGAGRRRGPPHSLRAAFAVRFLESHPGEVEALQRLMGHSKTEPTQIYLRRLDRETSNGAG
jgi:site-specific recombinase XerD